MIPMDLKEAQGMAISHVCGECAGILVVPWGFKEFGIEGHVLVCGTDHSHEGIVKRGTVPLEDQPIYVRNVIERKERKRMNDEFGEEVGTALAEYQGNTSLTQKQATFILRECWPDAPDKAVLKAAMICAQYGLNPLMKHLYLVEYRTKTGSKWVPILGIGATRLIASRKGKYGFHDGPRVMTEIEQRDIFGEVFADRIMAIVTLKDAEGNTAPGYGSWPRNDTPYGVEKGNTKANMAFIRAERNAFDRMFPGEMPADIDVADLTFAKDLDLEAPAPAKKLAAPANKGTAKPKSSIGPQSPVYSEFDQALNKIRMAMNLLGQDEMKEDFVNYLKSRFETGMMEELTIDQANMLLTTLKARVDLQKDTNQEGGDNTPAGE